MSIPMSRRRLAHTARTFVLLALAASCARGDATAGAPIEPAELAGLIASAEPPVILDVRSPEEFASGHIPGAVNIPYDQLSERLAASGLSPTDEIVVHCESGRRAQIAETALRDSGYTDVRDLTGHMAAWRAGGYPLE
jgi:rhodanese-related sulfurtransferase